MNNDSKKDEKTDAKKDTEKVNKKINKNFLLIILGIFLVCFLIIIIVSTTRSCSRATSNYESVENKVLDAAKSYYKSNSDELPDVSENVEISAETLAEKKFMKPLTSLLKDTSCEAKVTVYNNNGFYLYIPDLKCAEYKTNHLVDVIKEDSIVTEETERTEGDYVSGLYYENGKYVFKGKKPNNYLKFSNIVWRIIEIDDNGIMRVVKNAPESRNYYWDTQYNVDMKSQSGKNDYKNSLIREKLNSDYAKFKDESKLHLSPFDVCVGKRNSNNLDKYSEVDCSVKLENEYISLVNVSDFSAASLDENCVKITSGACRNYNYLSFALSQSWTVSGLEDNSYEVFYLSGGVPNTYKASTLNSYNWVVAFNGNELYVSGTGTEADPYIIAK